MICSGCSIEFVLNASTYIGRQNMNGDDPIDMHNCPRCGSTCGVAVLLKARQTAPRVRSATRFSRSVSIPSRPKFHARTAPDEPLFGAEILDAPQEIRS